MFAPFTFLSEGKPYQSCRLEANIWLDSCEARSKLLHTQSSQLLLVPYFLEIGDVVPLEVHLNIRLQPITPLRLGTGWVLYSHALLPAPLTNVRKVVSIHNINLGGNQSKCPWQATWDPADQTLKNMGWMRSSPGLAAKWRCRSRAGHTRGKKGKHIMVIFLCNLLEQINLLCLI